MPGGYPWGRADDGKGRQLLPGTWTSAFPVLGICLGMQAIALARGGSVSPGSMGGYGLVEVEIVEPDEILRGYPAVTNVWASHMDEVTRLPEGFTLLASSRICAIEALADPKEHLYGVQWHPEVSHTVSGRLTFENFDRLCHEP